MAPPRTNLTGFDIRKFAAAGGSPGNDPWRRAEAWRSTGPFTRFNRFKGTLPGLGSATVLFSLYLAYDYTFGKDEHAHTEGHGEEHH